MLRVNSASSMKRNKKLSNHLFARTRVDRERRRNFQLVERIQSVFKVSSRDERGVPIRAYPFEMTRWKKDRKGRDAVGARRGM